MNPVQRPDVIIQKAGEETMLYTIQSKAVHILNPTAKQIWDLCDGEHTVEDMEQTLRTIFDIPPEHNLASDIQEALESFYAKGLLQT